jgi:coenzyme F420-0:L-glutamate ligase / coenzyme F420-1:gamma-L-glutamate ligase
VDGLHARALEPLPDVRPGDDLAALIEAVVPPNLTGGDVLVVAHKVVSKAEGCVRTLDSISPGERALALAAEHRKDARLVQAVLDESAEVLRARDGVLICETHHGFVCANAGVDQSNATEPGELILLPADPDASARRLRAGLPGRPAVVIADSFGRPWRLGQTDVALGAAGLMVLDDWTGRRDAYGRELRATSIGVADAAAAAADLARAKDSRRPVVLLRGLERYVTEEDGPGAAPLRRAREQDLFR